MRRIKKTKSTRKRTPSSFNKFLAVEEYEDSLECGWVGCGQMFDSLEVLTMHLREVHLFASQHCEQPLHCFWQDCENFDGIHELHLTVHVMFHAYHTKLKASGQGALAGTELKCLLVANNSSIPEQPVGGYVCEYDYGKCLETFDSFHSFLTHLSCHIYSFSDTSDDNLVCRWANCTRLTPFEKRVKLLEHMRCHTGAKSHACPQCGTFFTTAEKLRGHCVRQILEEEAKTFKCNLCNVSFVSQPLLSEHIRTHVKLYQCDQCPLPFASKAGLRNHWKYKHSNTRDFPCLMPKCSYSAKKRNDLLKHLHGHRQACTHICSFCGDMFRTKPMLEQHLREIHSVPTRKEYICHICGPDKTYARGRSLTEHLKKKHEYKALAYKRFQYMQAEDGKYYLAKEEYHECIPVNESSSCKMPVKSDFIESLNDLDVMNYDMASYAGYTYSRESRQESMETGRCEDNFDGLEASAY